VGFTGLHGVAYLGVVELVAALLVMKKWDVNASDCTGNTPLTWAAYKGYEEVVKLLLKREDVNPNHAPTKYGWTPLLLAARSGHEAVVKLLLQREDVNPDQTNTEYGRTPLSFAAEGGHEGVVKILLERNDVNPNQPDTESGLTPLSWAAGSGREGVVRALLERNDVNPNQADTKYSQTPLLLAAGRGHEGVVKVLLERKDVNPDQAETGYGRTPLWWAVQGGFEGIVKAFLERKDVRTDTPDHQNQVPLPAVPPKAGDELIDILQEPGHVSLHAAGCISQESFPPSAEPWDECIAEIQFSSHHHYADIPHSNSHPPPLPVDSVELEHVPELKDSVPTSPDGLRATEPSVLPQSASL